MTLKERQNSSHEQEDEETYLRNVTRFMPRLEHRFSPTLTGFIGYRVEYDKLNDIAAATVQSLGGVRRAGVLSGPTRRSGVEHCGRSI